MFLYHTRLAYEEFYLTEDETEILSLIGHNKMTQEEIVEAITQKYWTSRTNDIGRQRLELFYKGEIARLMELGMLVARR